MGILSWIIVGGLAGWIASMIMGKNAQMGILANIVAGVVGAIIAGFVHIPVRRSRSSGEG